MNWVDKLSARTWSILVICVLAFAFSGCDGKDGAPGATGAVGPIGPIGPEGPPGPSADDIAKAIANADAESCGTCHGEDGDKHYAEYAKYTDASAFELTIGNVSSQPSGADFLLRVSFSITHFGAPYIDPVGMPPSVDATTFYVAQYDSATGLFSRSGSGFFPSLDVSLAASNGAGTYLLAQVVPYDVLAFDGGAIVGKIADDELDIEDKQYNPAMGKRVKMYAHTSTSAFPLGTIGAFQSLANVEGCEACHAAPYRKHGNIEAVAAGGPDFLQCKACHSDDRSGGHEDWQYMVDDPFGWATGVAATADYAYQATLMNDTHMSHAMEFPYPQSMANCSTCHAGNLTEILDDQFFTVTTCKSCHVVEGIDAWPEDAGTTLEGMYAQPHRPPPMEFLWAKAGVDSFHDIGLTCTQCHGTGQFTSFADLHSGYDDHIYDDNGVKFADQFTVSVDNVTMAGDLMTINFSSNDPAIIPEILVSFYGGDTRNFIVGSHERDANTACAGFRPGCKMEYVPESSGGSANPLFTEDAASVPGDWMVTLDTSALQLTKTDLIPAMIANGRITKAEISITPEIEIGGQDVVLLAVGETFDLTGNMFIADYFKGANATVEVGKCNACHDSLASTFHDGSGRGGDGIEVCKHCHTTTFPGSHIEMASRGIDSYVHAIHTFQPFDEDDVAAANDPVFNARNAQHKNHVFPHFTALSCEGCHVTGTYNAPDQSKSMFGVLQSSWDIDDRAIGTVPEAVTGPASRACGGCHRANMVIEDQAGDLASFNAHTDAFGTFEANDDNDAILFGIIDKIMSMFE